MTERTAAQHAPVWGFVSANGCLNVGGMPLTRLVDRVGSTPFYAYDRELISRRIGELRQHVPSEIRLSYAIKANPMPAVVQHMASLVDGFDVASAGEMRTALDTPMAADQISFAGPGKRETELSRAVASGVLVHVESERELPLIEAAAQRIGLRPRIAVRINPDFQLRGAGMQMGGGAQPFGIDAARVPTVLRQITDMDLAFVGFQIFAGSQNLNAEALQTVQMASVEMAIRLAEEASVSVRHLNVGGGFGIPYAPGDQPLDLAAAGDGLAKALRRAKEGLGDVRMVLELGRYIVGEAGIYVCRVLDRKESGGKVFLITDGGLHHHLAATGNLGQVIRRNFPVAVGNNFDAPATETVTIAGPLCTPLDRLAVDAHLPRVEPGDLVVVFLSGAYGASASPVAFLGHPPPAEVLV